MQGKNPLQPKRSAEEMQFLLKEQSSSGLTVKQFCQDQHLSQAIFYYWQKRLRGEAANTKASAGFKQMAVKSEDNSYGGQLFAEYKGIRFYQEPSVAFLKQLIG